MSIGTTDAISALFRKVEVLILLLMAIDSGSAKKSDANLTSLVRILSIPGAILEFRDFSQDGIDFLSCYFRSPNGRRYRNGTGL